MSMRSIAHTQAHRIVINVLGSVHCHIVRWKIQSFLSIITVLVVAHILSRKSNQIAENIKIYPKISQQQTKFKNVTKNRKFDKIRKIE